MKYHGGKSRLAKHIVSAITDTVPSTDVPFFDVFAGGMNITCTAAGVFDARTANDIDSELIDMWRDVQDGWLPPISLSEDRYRELREQDTPSSERTFASIACSFGAKKWGGYARDPKGGHDYAASGYRSIKAKQSKLEDVNLLSVDYRDLVIPDGSVVYCDPPYANTTGYRSGKFDHDEFWKWCDDLSERAHVFVSEFTVPEDWSVVWSLPRKISTSIRDYKEKTDILVYRGT